MDNEDSVSFSFPLENIPLITPENGYLHTISELALYNHVLVASSESEEERAEFIIVPWSSSYPDSVIA